MKEALYYSKGEKDIVYCVLCPHYCKIPPERLGKCRVRKNIDGKLYTLNYGKITSYAYDPIEKKPLYHFYPGSSIFSIGTFGCNLECDFCQNWETVYHHYLSVDMEDKDIFTLAKAKDSIGIAYTYNEPGMWYEYVLYLSKKSKDMGLKNVLVTNGYINREPLLELLPYIDAMNIDLKSMNEGFYKTICKGSLTPVLETIEEAYKTTHIEITTLVIDDENSSSDEIEELAKKISSIDKSIPLHLSRYFPAYKMKLPPTKIETLLNARDTAKKYLDYIYIGNYWGTDNNTYCPSCRNTLIERRSGVDIIGLNNDYCNKCNERINIIN